MVKEYQPNGIALCAIKAKDCDVSGRHIGTKRPRTPKDKLPNLVLLWSNRREPGDPQDRQAGEESGP